MKRLSISLLAIGLAAVQYSYADVRLPKVFGSHMVLQRRKPVPVWGWADPNEKVTVTLNNQTKTGKAGKDGKWRLHLDPLEAGGPYQFAVRGKNNAILYDDVLVGDVWVCSGQSNMEWPLGAATNAKEEVKAASYPQIRQLLVKKTISLSPKEDVEGEWDVCSPATASKFTAVGYFFARNLQKDLNVPIGLINTSWGGTHSETWTSREAMASDPELTKSVANLPASVEAMQRSGSERTAKLLQQQQGGQLPGAAEERTWATAAYNAQAWKTMAIGGDWEWKGIPTLDGVVWFRREIMIPENASLKNSTLQFGPIDDADSTYVNGQLVGSAKNKNAARSYSLPDGLLKPGRNLIAVRVEDTGGSGGFMGDTTQFKLTVDKLAIPLTGNWQYRIAKVFPSSYEAGPNSYGTLLFNAMIKPLIPYAIEGVIWYQGESNTGRAYQYRRTFPLMIQDWRQQWAKADPAATTPEGTNFPFLFVQLANYNAANGNSQKGSSWAELREAQTLTLSLPNTGMAVTSDIGTPGDIHPRNKQDVGKRLAAEAMRVAYSQNQTPTVEASRGPMFASLKTEGSQAVLTLNNLGSGLLVKDKYGYLKGFEVAGSDQQFHYAKAQIRDNQIVVQTDSVTAPVAVRYSWADDSGDGNVYNKEGFPMTPFRTDTWKGITENGKFEQ